jgi:RimJ/RimL family protein N-acetyltransferase
MSQIIIPSNIRLETQHYVLRTLRPEDASERFGQWMGDEAAMAMLNSDGAPMTLAEVVDYIRSFDNESRFLIGIFVRDSGLHIGAYSLRLDIRHRRLVTNTLIGEPEYRGRHVWLETRPFLHDFFFTMVGVEKLVATVIADNTAHIDNLLRSGWVQEGRLRGHVLAPDGVRRFDLLQFGLLPEDWQRWRAANVPKSC